MRELAPSTRKPVCTDSIGSQRSVNYSTFLGASQSLPKGCTTQFNLSTKSLDMLMSTFQVQKGKALWGEWGGDVEEGHQMLKLVRLVRLVTTVRSAFRPVVLRSIQLWHHCGQAAADWFDSCTPLDLLLLVIFSSQS